MDAETRATNKANREMDALRHLHLQEANKTIIEKLDRIIQLLEEMNRLNPKSTYDFVITGGEQAEKVTPSGTATCEGEKLQTPTAKELERAYRLKTKFPKRK